MDKLSHRKATAHLRLVNADGTPVANRPIDIMQTSHHFLFGCGVFEAVDMMRAKTDEEREFLNRLLNKWLGLFNFGTLPFYWGRYEREQGLTEKEPTLKAAKWLRERGVTLKGHPLCWHTACADWLMQYSNEEILRRQLERIHRDMTDFKGVIDMWDVINEVVIMPDFDKYDNAITRICKDKGRIALVKEVFAAAKESNPNATLLINDFNTSVAYEILLEGLLEAGVPISVIGIQSHQHQGYWGREKLENVLERYSRFGLPIHFTENTLISGELMPGHIVDLNDYQVSEWPSTEEGEARQAREITEMYTVLFNHPSVEAITTWDFADDAWLHAPAGFVRTDNTEKPAYHALHSLIHGEWETNEQIVTDSDGYVSFTGFKGSYTLTIDGRKTETELTEDVKKTLTLR